MKRLLEVFYLAPMEFSGKKPDVDTIGDDDRLSFKSHLACKPPQKRRDCLHRIRLGKRTLKQRVDDEHFALDIVERVTFLKRQEIRNRWLPHLKERSRNT